MVAAGVIRLMMVRDKQSLDGQAAVDFALVLSTAKTCRMCWRHPGLPVSWKISLTSPDIRV